MSAQFLCDPRPDLTEAVPVKLITHTCPNKEEMQLYFNGELPGRPSWILDDGDAEEESDERLDGDANEWTGGGASGYSNETEMTRTTQHPLVGLFPIFLSARFFFILGLKAVPETERDCEVVAVWLGHGGAILQVEVLAPTCYPLPNPGGDWRLSTFFQVPEHLRGRVVQPKELLLLDGEYMDDVDENGDPYDCYEDELRADPNVLDPKGSLMRSSDMEDMAARAQAELSALWLDRNKEHIELAALRDKCPELEARGALQEQEGEGNRLRAYAARHKAATKDWVSLQADLVCDMVADITSSGLRDLEQFDLGEGIVVRHNGNKTLLDLGGDAGEVWFPTYCCVPCPWRSYDSEDDGVLSHMDEHSALVAMPASVALPVPTALIASADPEPSVYGAEFDEIFAGIGVTPTSGDLVSAGPGPTVYGAEFDEIFAGIGATPTSGAPLGDELPSWVSRAPPTPAAPVPPAAFDSPGDIALFPLSPSPDHLGSAHYATSKDFSQPTSSALPFSGCSGNSSPQEPASDKSVRSTPAAWNISLYAPSALMRSAPAFFLCKWGV